MHFHLTLQVLCSLLRYISTKNGPDFPYSDHTEFSSQPSYKELPAPSPQEEDNTKKNLCVQAFWGYSHF